MEVEAQYCNGVDTALNLFRRGFCTLELFYYSSMQHKHINKHVFMYTE